VNRAVKQIFTLCLDSGWIIYSTVDNIYSTSVEGIPQVFVVVQTLWSAEKSEVLAVMATWFTSQVNIKVEDKFHNDISFLWNPH